MRVLGALVHRFHEAGIGVLVWVSPTNVEHLASLGVELDGLERTVQSARAVVEANGGTLVDLHATLHDSGFRDPADHFTLDGEDSGGATVARRLAQAISTALSETKPADPPNGKAAHAVQ
jgi:hypothetical protein